MYPPKGEKFDIPEGTQRQVPYAGLYSCKGLSIHAYAEVRTRLELRLSTVKLLIGISLTKYCSRITQGACEGSSSLPVSSFSSS